MRAGAVADSTDGAPDSARFIVRGKARRFEGDEGVPGCALDEGMPCFAVRFR